MTPDELDVLLSDGFRRTVEACRGRDPLEVALDGRVPHARLVSTQLKYLARAARKLPSFAAAECVLPPRAYEQASGEACAAHKPPGGDAVLDLTCGMGVDAWYLSRRFRRVVALERDPALARIARENFRRLGAGNIEVVCAAAEDYLRQPDLRFDWIFADPDRRADDGSRRAAIEACSPDVAALDGLIRRAAPRLCLKLSPLYDAAEALRRYPAARVEAVSAEGECKELLVVDDGTGPLLTATALGTGSFSARPEEVAPPPPAAFDPARYRYLVAPDAALRKMRLARLHLAGRADIWSESGFGLAFEAPGEVLGRIFAVEAIEPFDAKQLRRSLRDGATIFERDFPAEASRALRRGVPEGDRHRVALTKICGRYWTIRLK